MSEDEPAPRHLLGCLACLCGVCRRRQLHSRSRTPTSVAARTAYQDRQSGTALQVDLYVRRGRQLEITPAGRKVQRFARELAASAADFQAELHDSRHRQPVVLCAGEGSYLYLLGEGLRRFKAASSQPLRLETGDRSVAIEAVRSARAHLGIASLESAPEGLRVRPLTKVGQVLVMAARHPLTARRTIRLKDLQGVSLIVPPAGRPHRIMLSRMLQSADIEWHVAMEASGWELMLQFVKLGLGLAVVNACCRLPREVRSRPMPELPLLQYYLFQLDKNLPPSAQQLKQSLLDCADSWKHASR